tara:strand:+ start:187 stop:411 length:225 start_codon:yes stop_codon:yes gene_type:complete
MGLIETFVTGMKKDENEKDNSLGFLLVLVLVKLLFIYIVMLLWPRVMPKVFPTVAKQPSYINLLGLSVILVLLI